MNLIVTDGEGRETPEQLEKLSRLIGAVNGETLDAFFYTLGAWFECRYQPGATDEWKKESRYNQAAVYIQWLEEAELHERDSY